MDYAACVTPTPLTHPSAASPLPSRGIPGASMAAFQQLLRQQALTLLEVCASAAPTSFLALDCLPKLAAVSQHGPPAAPGAVAAGVEALPPPTVGSALVKQQLQQQQALGGKASLPLQPPQQDSMAARVSSHEGASTSGGGGNGGLGVPSSIGRVLRRHAALSAAVSPRCVVG